MRALRIAQARLSLSRMPSQVQLVRDLWRTYESGGLDAFFAMAGDDVVWQPFITGVIVILAVWLDMTSRRHKL